MTIGSELACASRTIAFETVAAIDTFAFQGPASLHARDSDGRVYVVDAGVLATASRQNYPEKLRWVCFRDPETGNAYASLTNDFTLPVLTIAWLYKSRWQVEIFFKWIKQHLRIKAFYGRSPNAVETQVRIAISVYVLVAIVKKRLGLGAISALCYRS